LLNKRDDLLILISGNEPDLILITEVLSKAHFTYMSSNRVDILDFFHYSNFDPNAEPVVGIRGVCICVSNKLVSSEVQFPTVSSLESLWIKVDQIVLLLVVCIEVHPVTLRGVPTLYVNS